VSRRLRVLLLPLSVDLPHLDFFLPLHSLYSWTCRRQPAQVFTLLESLYGAFDAIARRRGVFKIETIGGKCVDSKRGCKLPIAVYQLVLSFSSIDCYVAVTGLPEARKDHALTMARFARDCLNKMIEITSELETTLGPGTADLALRVGLNSGPTTAGVLRGEKSRFQLFGDTVNTAARMESNSQRNRIMVSQKTAELITEAGKGHWLTPREDKVHAKGKGEMQCYWCLPHSGTTGSTTDNTCSDNEGEHGVEETPKLSREASLQRLIGWNVDFFKRMLEKVVSCRTTDEKCCLPVTSIRFSSSTPIEEVKEIISLPKLDNAGSSKTCMDVELSDAVKQQLEDYITTIASMYKVRLTTINYPRIFNLRIRITISIPFNFFHFRPTPSTTLSMRRTSPCPP